MRRDGADDKTMRIPFMLELAGTAEIALKNGRWTHLGTYPKPVVRSPFDCCHRLFVVEARKVQLFTESGEHRRRSVVE